MPESYDRLTRDRLVNIILFIFAGNRGRRGEGSVVIELWYSAAEYVNQITYDEFGAALGLYNILCTDVYLYLLLYAQRAR